MLNEKDTIFKGHFDSLLHDFDCDAAIDYLMDEFNEDYVAGTMDSVGIMAGQDADAILQIYLRKRFSHDFEAGTYITALKEVEELSEKQHLSKSGAKRLRTLVKE